MNVTIRVEAALVVAGAQQIAVVRCGRERLDVGELQATLRAMPSAVTHVCLAKPETARTTILSLVGRGAPCATARPVTDALKEVAEGRIVAGVDRRTLFRAALPMLMDIQALRDRMTSLGEGGVPAGALIGHEPGLRFVDEGT